MGACRQRRRLFTQAALERSFPRDELADIFLNGVRNQRMRSHGVSVSFQEQ